MLCSSCTAVIPEADSVLVQSSAEILCARCATRQVTEGTNVLGPMWPSGMAVRRTAERYTVYLSWIARDLDAEHVEALSWLLGRLKGQKTTLEDIADLAREFDREEDRIKGSLPERRLQCYACGEATTYVRALQGRGLLQVIESPYRELVHAALELDNPHGPPSAYDEDRPVVCPECVRSALRAVPEQLEPDETITG